MLLVTSAGTNGRTKSIEGKINLKQHVKMLLEMGIYPNVCIT